MRDKQSQVASAFLLVSNPLFIYNFTSASVIYTNQNKFSFSYIEENFETYEFMLWIKSGIFHPNFYVMVKMIPLGLWNLNYKKVSGMQ